MKRGYDSKQALGGAGDGDMGDGTRDGMWEAEPGQEGLDLVRGRTE